MTETARRAVPRDPAMQADQTNIKTMGMEAEIMLQIKEIVNVSTTWLYPDHSMRRAGSMRTHSLALNALGTFSCCKLGINTHPRCCIGPSFHTTRARFTSVLASQGRSARRIFLPLALRRALPGGSMREPAEPVPFAKAIISKQTTFA